MITKPSCFLTFIWFGMNSFIRNAFTTPKNRNNLIIKKQQLWQLYWSFFTQGSKYQRKTLDNGLNQPNLFLVRSREMLEIRSRQVPLAAWYNKTSRKTSKEKEGGMECTKVVTLWWSKKEWQREKNKNTKCQRFHLFSKPPQSRFYRCSIDVVWILCFALDLRHFHLIAVMCKIDLKVRIYDPTRKK